MEEGRDNHRQRKGIHKKQKNTLKMKEVINKIQVVTQKNTRKNTQIMEVTHKGTAMVSQSLEIQAKNYKIIQVVCAQLVYLVFLSPSVSSPECLVFRRELQITYNVAQVKSVVENQPPPPLIHLLAQVHHPLLAQSPSNRLEISSSQKPSVKKVGNVSATCFAMHQPQWSPSE